MKTVASGRVTVAVLQHRLSHPQTDRHSGQSNRPNEKAACGMTCLCRLIYGRSKRHAVTCTVRHSPSTFTFTFPTRTMGSVGCLVYPSSGRTLSHSEKSSKAHQLAGLGHRFVNVNARSLIWGGLGGMGGLTTRERKLVRQAKPSHSGASAEGGYSAIFREPEASKRKKKQKGDLRCF